MVAEKAIDLFAGAGGATQGLRDAGFEVVAAVENHPDAASTWSLNHPGKMYIKDVRDVLVDDLLVDMGLQVGELTLLKSCPPCQGFSTLRGARAADEDRNDLVLDTLRFVKGLLPRAVLIENVPGLARDARFEVLTNGLEQLEYKWRSFIIDASELGVPQRRRRLVVVATRGSEEVPKELSELIDGLDSIPRVSAGESLRALARLLPPDDPFHCWRTPTELVAKRIAAIPVGGNRFDLPLQLQLECHKRLVTAEGKDRKTAMGSYGRVKIASAAPTMTTRCTTPACGSFIHPTENRGLSLREAASFQTFPHDYEWSGNYGSVERQIGNAVPVRMAEVLGSAVLSLLSESRAGGKRAAVPATHLSAAGG